VRDPERNVPRATMIGILIVGVVYLLTSTPVALLMPPEQAAASNAPFADFIALYWSPGLALLIGLFAAVSAIGALNGWVLLQGEMALAMARQGVFPRWFDKTSRGGIAVRAQILSSGLATILIAANYSRSVGGLFAFMALVSTAAALVLYFACALAALRLQQTGRMAGSTGLSVIAALAALYAVWTLYGAGYEATGWGAALLAIGIPVYFLMKRAARSSPAAEAFPAASPE